MAIMKRGTAMLTTLPQLGMGWKALKSDKPKEAMLCAYKMLNQDPTNTQGLDLLIRAMQEMEIFEVAVLAAEAAVASSPSNPEFLRTLAKLYRAAGQPSRALDAYERMLELEPNDPDVLRDMKDTHTELHMEETKIEEVKSYRDMIKDKDEAVNLEQEAKVVRSEERIDDLIVDVQTRLEQQPNNVSLVRKLADLYMQKNDFDNAEKCLAAALKQEGSDPSLEKMLGDLRVRRVDSQIKKLKAELETKPEDAQLRQQLAELQSQREQLRLEETEARAKRYPNDLGIRYELGVLYFQRGIINKALEEFQQALKNPQNRIHALNYLGLCFRHEKHSDLAIKQFEIAEKEYVLMDNLKKEIIYNLADTLEQMGKNKEAKDQFLKIYEVDINFRDVAQRIKNLSKDS
jgi:tetratricopeptide (TPR) repeat protein